MSFKNQKAMSSSKNITNDIACGWTYSTVLMTNP